MGDDPGRWRDRLVGLARHKMLLLMLGGAVGTCARYGVGRWFAAQPWAQGFPFGTLVINVTGSFILAVAAVVLLEKLPPEYADWYLLVGVGFCGGYTTFSSFEWETFRLVQNGSIWTALAYVVGSVLAGFAAILLGVIVAHAVFGRE